MHCSSLRELVTSRGRAAYVGGAGESGWRFSLPDTMLAFGVLPGESPVASPVRGLWACVAVGSNGKHIAIASMQSPMVHVLRKPLAEIHGLSWSPDGRKLCVVARDPAIGAIVFNKTAASVPLSACSLFTAAPDEDDLVALAGPVAAPGAPRWSPASDAVAVLEPERSGRETVSLVMLNGEVKPLMTGPRVTLGDRAWTSDGHLLCAVRYVDGKFVPCLVDTAGGVSKLSGGWEEIVTLTLADDGAAIVSGRWGNSWCIAHVSEDSTDPIASFASPVSCTTVACGRLWFVAPTKWGDPGLWTSDLTGYQLELKLTARSVRDLRVRADGMAAAVMTGDAEKEIVCVMSAHGSTVDKVGRRDAVWGWAEEHMPPEKRRSRLWHSLR